MEEEDEFVGCISCTNTNDLCDLFVAYGNNEETYGQMLETCFDVKVSNYFKYICTNCVEKLEKSYAFKSQTVNTIDTLQSIKDEEYLDEEILEDDEDEGRSKKNVRQPGDCGDDENDDDQDEEHEIEALDETTCIYCNLQLSTVEGIHHHIRLVHGLEPRTGRKVRDCNLCGASLRNLADHFNRCHNPNAERQGRQYACHFCDNVYNSKKACFTHLRMKHGLKLCNDHTPKYSSRDRKKCHICGRDFSQKQILNNHLWKAHGFEVEKRKAFFCPLCSERVSYGANFSAHLLQRHDVSEQVEQLEFSSMDDFMMYKSAIQEESKFRFRKTTASKQTIEGVRSHYMCSQSGIYVYQGKGKRPAPERQIYKTGKACPAHMIVTETLDKVLVTFYKTHVGHGPIPNNGRMDVSYTNGKRGVFVLDTKIIFNCIFPKNVKRKNTWLSIISIKGKFYTSAKICSLHFKSEDYDASGRLRNNATPFYLPSSCDCVSTFKESYTIEPSTSTGQTNIRSESVNTNTISMELLQHESKENFLDLDAEYEPQTKRPRLKDFNIQVNKKTTLEISLKKSKKILQQKVNQKALISYCVYFRLTTLVLA